MSPQPTPKIPTASRLLPLLGRLLHRIPSWRGLRPFLLRPPPAASGFYPLASPPTPLVPRLPPFALRPLAFVASLSRHSRPRRRPGRRPPAWRLALATPGPTRISSSCPRSPQTTPKSAPPQPKSFLEKTLNAREAAAIRAPGHPTAPPAPRHACLAGLPFACCSARMPAYVPG